MKHTFEKGIPCKACQEEYSNWDYFKDEMKAFLYATFWHNVIMVLAVGFALIGSLGYYYGAIGAFAGFGLTILFMVATQSVK